MLTLVVRIRKSQLSDPLSYHPGPDQNLYYLQLVRHVDPADPKLQNLSMIQVNNRITGKSLDEDPVLMVSQKSEISNQHNDSLQ